MRREMETEMGGWKRKATVVAAMCLSLALLAVACGKGGGGGGEPRPDVPFCIPACETAMDCPPGEWECREGFCVDPAQADNPESCDNVVCGDLTCEDGQCVCESDEQCPGDLFCRSNGACGCRSDADCGGSGIDTCFNGYCGCGSDETCGFFEQIASGDWVCKTPEGN